MNNDLIIGTENEISFYTQNYKKRGEENGSTRKILITILRIIYGAHTSIIVFKAKWTK